MKFITLVGQVILLVFLGLIARGLWDIYREQAGLERVGKDGVRLEVQIRYVSHAKRDWRDYLGNSRYITFVYEGKEYSLRYVQDSVFLQDGVLVPVIYSPSNDDFIQPGQGWRSGDLYKTSPLVRWTVLRLFSGARAALFFFVVVTAVVLILLAGFVANLTGIGVIGRGVKVLVWVCAFGGAVFLTYDTIAHWRYYSRLRHEGTAQTVPVEDIDRRKEFNNDESRVLIFYVYQARVRWQHESRIIAVGKEDFEHVRPGDPLNVLYAPAMDDMMSVHYTLPYHDLVFLLIVWVILGYTLWRRRGRAGNT